ncbi:unnamed protein product [Protopolystoma xenopodis]|uniref:Uncharacterized protein n=1 Tax=Protopolystoma xenopodis TaxID=117903 RepID=A0A3S5CJ17_9PLAT|nr:unnamed protein product [Protopolystoma xenopodis]
MLVMVHLSRVGQLSVAGYVSSSRFAQQARRGTLGSAAATSPAQTAAKRLEVGHSPAGQTSPVDRRMEGM